MNSLELFIYFVAVVLLYGSPLNLLALFIGWRQRRLLRVIGGIFISVPVLAGLFVLGTLFGLGVTSLRYDSQSEAMVQRLGDDDARIYEGHFAGEISRNGQTLQRYVFDVPNGRNSEYLEVLTPPGISTSAGYMAGTDDYPRQGEPARFVVFNAGSWTTPSAGTTSTYLSDYYPGLEVTVPPHRILMMYVHPDQSTLWYAREGEQQWRWQYLVIDYQSF